VAGNLVPATQGLRQSEQFTIPDPNAPPPGPVVVRVGPNPTPQDAIPDYRYCLAAGEAAWHPTGTQDEDTTVPAVPELVLLQQNDDGTTTPWSFQRWLLDSGAGAPVFTLTPERYSPVLVAGGRAWWDYDGDAGTTIRFGNGTFGAVPLPSTAFSVVYRTGAGAAGNVPADTVTDIVPGQSTPVTACTNPFTASGGADEETVRQVRDRAPQQFRAEPLRVVRPEDYVAAARTLPWVQQAGTTFRWTGSWLTVFTSADPVGVEQPGVADLELLTQLLDRERLAGYESYVLPPDYVSVDLRIVVCGKPSYFASDVEKAILQRLQPGPLPGGAAGFFDHSRWGFGQALEPSALLAAIQSCPGVDGVYSVLYRQRGVQADWTELLLPVTVGANEILRVDDDPSRPEAGSLQVTVEGSK
jgi:predicted phage baseplate assembly protein